MAGNAEHWFTAVAVDAPMKVEIVGEAAAEEAGIHVGRMVVRHRHRLRRQFRRLQLRLQLRLQRRPEFLSTERFMTIPADYPGDWENALVR